MSVFVPEGVLFDMDGTITDIKPSYNAMCRVFKRSGLNPPSFPEYVEHFHAPYEEFYHVRMVRFSKTEIWEIYLLDKPHEKARIFPDVFETIRHFVGLKARLGVVSSNDIRTVRHNCRRARIDTFLDCVVGNTYSKVPATREFCQVHEIDPKRVLFVGDFPSDMRDAVESGVIPIGISHGEAISQILAAAGAVHVVKNLLDLTKLQLTE